MTWNEPGKNRDPWGGPGDNNGSGKRGGGEQGPPDLDEVFRKLKDRLFGGGQGGGGGRGVTGQGPSGPMVGLIAAAVLVLWLLSGFYTVDDAERGVVMRLGDYERTVGAGLHWRIPWPVETVEKVNVNAIQRFNYRSQMLTRDENIVVVDVNVQYKVGEARDLQSLSEQLMESVDAQREVHVSELEGLEDSQAAEEDAEALQSETGDELAEARQIDCVYEYPDYSEGSQEEAVNPEAVGPTEAIGPAHDYLFNVRDPDFTLHEVTESAVREIVGSTRMDCILIGQGRTYLELSTHLSVQETLNRYHAGIEITQVNLQDVNFPEAVQPAVEDAIKAREDRERLILEAQSYRNSVVPRARGEAARRVEEARAYRARAIDRAEGDASRFTQLVTEYRLAPEVTRERLYLETMEEVLGRTPKVLIDTSDGNGNMIYLPVDKMLENRRRNTPGSDSAGQSNGGDGSSGNSDSSSGSNEQPNLREGLRSRGGRR